jgi:TATA-box binding protein (TBP) (component of TFIID and TFIIIB)
MSFQKKTNIDDEWASFISVKNNDASSDEEDAAEFEEINEFIENDEETISSNISFDFSAETPKASNIYISTKTKIAYLNSYIDLKNVFWSIPVIPYAKPCNGVIKKQMKFNSVTEEELNFIKDKLVNEIYYEENIITNINNPSGRIKFKDIRKVSIGISKKDLMSYRCKKKSAFYNCFVLILRINIAGVFKEYHVKIFNTGKMEIPGVQTEETFQMVLSLVIEILQPHISSELKYKENSEETVLINSNFNCGFFINREALNDILKYKYNIQAIYDPCSYPGIQCKFYYNPDLDNNCQSGSQISEENKELYKNIKQVSFMIFRTGSVLIVGKCDENVLMIIYEFLKIILNNEFRQICQKNLKLNGEQEIIIHQKEKDKKKKTRRKNITVSI